MTNFDYTHQIPKSIVFVMIVRYIFLDIHCHINISSTCSGIRLTTIASIKCISKYNKEKCTESNIRIMVYFSYGILIRWIKHNNLINETINILNSFILLSQAILVLLQINSEKRYQLNYFVVERRN